MCSIIPFISVAMFAIPTQAGDDTLMKNLNPNWEYVADQVMGGVSNGAIVQATIDGQTATVLHGDVSLENNGGFIQMAFNLMPDGSSVDVSAWDGIALTVKGNDQRYDIRLRTDQLARPWQSFRTEFTASSGGRTLHIPFSDFVAHKIDVVLDPTQLRRIGVLAIGRKFHAEVAVSAIQLYRD